MFKLRSGAQAPEQVAAAIIGYVRTLAERRFGVRFRRAVMTMSAGAPPGYRDAIIRAARIAHLEIVDLIAEPVAASLALDLHSYPGDRRIVVCDFGGSTFDVSAVVQQGLRFTPVAIGGDHLLGGDDLDDALANTIAGVIYRRTRYDMTRDLARWTELVLRCENVKRQLSVVESTPLAMREAYAADGKRHDLRTIVDRPFAEHAWATLMHRVKDVIEDLLARTGWAPEQVDLVGLVGGGSMIPVFQSTVASVLPGERIRRADQPELAVAQGATLLTARHGHTSSDLPNLVA
jgi:molecular chaperone DnaK (HSP70)